jgi:hypothetical protein
MATLITSSESPEPRLYISSYYAILGQSIFFKFETPKLFRQNIIKIVLDTGEENLSESETSRLTLDLDPNTPILDNLTYTYKSTGKYFINYTVTYQSTVNNKITTQTFFIENPITVLRNWPRFRQQDIRILGENILRLPYTFEQIQINPNEFGTSGVYNTSLRRLHECLEYLKSNTSILNSKTPSLYYGWFGLNSLVTSNGFRWHTPDYLSEYYNNVTAGVGFSDIKDIAETNNLIFILNNKDLSIYVNSERPSRLFFRNQDELLETLTDITSFDVTTDGRRMFLLDGIQNKVYRIDIDFDANNSIYQSYNPVLSLTHNIGSYGDESDPFTFNNPTKILCINGLVYVLDFNNKCIKVYTERLEWVYTYNPPQFQTDQPISLAVQKDTNFVYVLSKTKVYVLPNRVNRVNSTFDITNLSNLEPRTIFFDEAGEFFYVVTKENVFKYTALGLYMDILDLPKGFNDENLEFITGKSGVNRNVLLTTKRAVIKCQEVTEILTTGQGLDVDYWSLSQILINSEELSQDFVINRAISRLCYNIVNFRNSLESKLTLSSESTIAGIIEYFRLYPLKAELRPKLGNDVESNNVAVGVNELHVPSVVNRELKKIYDALLVIKTFLDIEPVQTESEIGRSLSRCPNLFCWSWRAMSTYNVKKPIIRTCNINPITFRELQGRFSNTDYVQTKTWVEASSECCYNVRTPI